MDSHRITDLGPRGKPRQVVCVAHPDCGWRRDVAGSPRPDDPIVLALVRRHLAEQATAVPMMMGHLRRPRP